MKIKRVLRYYCDFCKKSGGGKAAMKLHEGRCIRNPNRTCGFCYAAGLETHSIPELVKAAAGDLNYTELRELTSSCPACMLCGIVNRRHQYPEEINYAHDFDFKLEVERFQNEQRDNDERLAQLQTYMG